MEIFKNIIIILLGAFFIILPINFLKRFSSKPLEYELSNFNKIVIRVLGAIILFNGIENLFF
ncbi:MAG: hypothetical protein ACK5LY_01720 [Lachnospirales bacterium]